MVEAGWKGVVKRPAQASSELSEAAALLEASHEAFLGTVEEGEPFVSATGCLYEKGDADQGFGTLYLLLSHLARHTRNIGHNPEVSLLVVEKKDALPIHERKRLTVKGRAERVEPGPLWETLKAKYLEAYPRSQIFFSLPDFQFYRIPVREMHWIGGFGKAATFR